MTIEHDGHPVAGAVRSWLYVPGSDARVIAKALASGADAVVLDLEDAVAPDRKADARAIVADAVRRAGDRSAGGPVDATAPDGATGPAPLLLVRINVRDGEVDADDVAAVTTEGLAGLFVPKVESPDTMRSLDDLLARAETDAGLPTGRVALVPMIESALGLVNAAAIAVASSRVARFAMGTIDYLADIAADGDPDGPATAHLRGHLIVVSRAAGLAAPPDAVHVDVNDVDGVEAAARRARALGHFGKTVIHPRHLDPVHRVFTPTVDEVARARRVIDAAAEAERVGSGGTVLDGRFVDPAVVLRARRTVDLAMRLGIG